VPFRELSKAECSFPKQSLDHTANQSALDLDNEHGPARKQGQAARTSVILMLICKRVRVLRTMSKRVYLAGPEVFLADARQIGARKRAICARYDLVGVYPADEEHAPDPALPLPEQGIAISRAMEHAMRSSDAMIVNLTPFRSPSADVGSAYEMGYMRALGRPIFAYSNDPRPFLDRVTAFCGDTLRRRPTGEYEDSDGMAIEPFTLCDNLMLAGAVTDGCLATATVAPTERYTALDAFERCVEWAATQLEG
jgi:nucleoside 2-deoxyribosyltransferase